MPLRLFATAALGLEHLLAAELEEFGANDIGETRAGVAFTGELATAYRACLWTRLASRVLLPLATFPVDDDADLYAGVQTVDWLAHLDERRTLAVSFTGTSDAIRDTMFGAQRVKDAIADQIRGRRGGARPSVDTRRPDVRVFAHLGRREATVGIDLSGEGLHRRGYRTPGEQPAAPLKETLAAAVLAFADWARIADGGGAFVDPLCGSGTLAIEAALVAADIAPGLARAGLVQRARSSAGFGFERWSGHDPATWADLVSEAEARRGAGLAGVAARRPRQAILGFDHDPRAVSLAQACVQRAGLGGVVAVARGELADLEAPAASGAPVLGLVATNLPYGERLGERRDLVALHSQFGARLRASFGGWHAVALAGDRELGLAIGLRSRRPVPLRNGPLPCVLLRVDVPAEVPAARASATADAPARAEAQVGRRKSRVPARPDDGSAGSPADSRPRPSESGAAQLANRLRKNLHHVGRTMRRQGVTCYRLYDADLPEYNLAIDVYERRLHVQEYAPPPEIDTARAAAHLSEALDVIAAVLGVQRGDIVVKQRRRQRGAAQYGRRGAVGALQAVTEDGLTYLVDLESYLDTGLFLDQRETRRLIRRLAGGRRFLNLFAYTGTATVCAIAGGATATTSVDLSRTYLEWASRNLAANGVSDVDLDTIRRGSRPAAHRLVRADCLRWIAETEGQFDLILVDPPTFSNSRRMGRATFDVQRDHADLIRMTTRRLLASDGVLLFACSRRAFKLDSGALPALALKDLSRATLAPDFARRAPAHHVWRIEAR